jgi:glycerol kinase
VTGVQTCALPISIRKGKLKAKDAVAIGITNQRETTVVFDKKTGKPIYNAIVWQCRRTSEYCGELKKEGLESEFRNRTGLVLDAYFSGTKIKWILDTVKNAREKAERGELYFGTIDTWLLYNLTGKKSHATDHTNASRTLIYNIQQKKWDEDLLKILTEPESSLIKQYTALIAVENIKLNFTNDGIKEIAKIAFKVNGEIENIGARRLHTLIEKVLEEISFTASDIKKGSEITIDPEFVNANLGDLVSNKTDLMKFVL